MPPPFFRRDAPAAGEGGERSPAPLHPLVCRGDPRSRSDPAMGRWGQPCPLFAGAGRCRAAPCKGTDFHAGEGGEARSVQLCIHLPRYNAPGWTPPPYRWPPSRRVRLPGAAAGMLPGSFRSSSAHPRPCLPPPRASPRGCPWELRCLRWGGGGCARPTPTGAGDGSPGPCGRRRLPRRLEQRPGP